MSHPPFNPKHGELYIIYNETSLENWKADGLRWSDRGFKHLPSKKPLVTSHYYNSFPNSTFQRRAYIKYNGFKYAEKTLLHYRGTKDIDVPHGNRKNKLNIRHIPTAKSVITEQKQNIKKTPQEVYRMQIQKDVQPALNCVLLPRDKKQVENNIDLERERKLLSRDDIVGVYLLNEELPNFIKMLLLIPDFIVIVLGNDSVLEFNKISEFDECYLSYDTTFNLGDFYVSPLTYRHPLFVGHRVVPLGYLIHDKKTTDCHEMFFNIVKGFCRNIGSKCIVTDRETSICNAIRNILPSSVNLFCWNHIQQDVKHWVKGHKDSDKGDIQCYVNHVWDLLDSDSESIFNHKREQMSQHWSQQFRIYFEKHLLDSIMRTGKWILLKVCIFYFIPSLLNSIPTIQITKVNFQVRI